MMNKIRQADLKPSCFMLDVDGVMTTGQFFYTAQGKMMKVFGPDDDNALSLLKPYLNIRFVTGDKIGFDIVRKRIVDDMHFPLDLVSAVHRIGWITKQIDPKKVIYMGDGIFDHYVMKHVGYSIAPANADGFSKKQANFVTKRYGGDRAVAEACLHILRKFFIPYNPNELPHAKIEFSQECII